MGRRDSERNIVFYRRRLPHWQPPSAIVFVTYRLTGSLPATVLARLREERVRLQKEPTRIGESHRERSLRIGKALFARMDDALGQELKGGSSQCAFSSRWLSDPRIARLVQENLLYWQSKRFSLHRYVIMPNHVHVLIEPLQALRESQADSLRHGPQADSLRRESQADSLRYESQADSPRHESQADSLRRESQADSPRHGPQADSLRYGDNLRYTLRQILQSLKGYTARKANELLGRQGPFWQRESFDHWVRDSFEYGRIVDYIDQNPVKAGLCAKPDQWEWSSAFGGCLR